MVAAPVDDQAHGCNKQPKPAQGDEVRDGGPQTDRVSLKPISTPSQSADQRAYAERFEPTQARFGQVADGDLCLPIPSFRQRAGLRGPATLNLPDAEGMRQRLMVSIQEIMLALEQCEDASDYRGLQARALLGEALDRRLAELRALDAQIARAAQAPVGEP